MKLAGRCQSRGIRMQIAMNGVDGRDEKQIWQRARGVSVEL